MLNALFFIVHANGEGRRGTFITKYIVWGPPAILVDKTAPRGVEHYTVSESENVSHNPLVHTEMFYSTGSINALISISVKRVL